MASAVACFSSHLVCIYSFYATFEPDNTQQPGMLGDCHGLTLAGN